MIKPCGVSLCYTNVDKAGPWYDLEGVWEQQYSWCPKFLSTWQRASHLIVHIMGPAICYNGKRSEWYGVLHGRSSTAMWHKSWNPASSYGCSPLILGHVEANYSLNERNIYIKGQLDACRHMILYIHENYEYWPTHVSGYGLQDWNGSQVVNPAGIAPCLVCRGRRDLHAGRVGSSGDRQLQCG